MDVLPLLLKPPGAGNAEALAFDRAFNRRQVRLLVVRHRERKWWPRLRFLGACAALSLFIGTIVGVFAPY